MKNNILKHSALIFFILTFAFTFLINLNVIYFGDDFYYLTFSNEGLKKYIDMNISHYLEVNGRIIVHVLASFFLWININIWKILNSLMLAGIVYYGSKLANFKSKNENSIFISSLIFFFGVCGLDILITRQSVYWLTGSFNYVYPLFVFFAYGYYLCNYNIDKKNFKIVVILALLASATVEQISVMTFGLTILLIISNYIKEKKLNKGLLIILFVTLIGMTSIIFSPSLNIRYGLETKDTFSVLDSSKEYIKHIIFSFFFSKQLLYYNLLLITFSILYIHKNINYNNKKENTKYNNINAILKHKNLFIGMLLIAMFLLIINVSILSKNKNLDILKILSITYLSFTYIFIFIYNTYFEYKKNPETYMILPASIILLIGSQFMMIISPVYGYRNILCGIFMMLLYAAYLSCHIIWENTKLDKYILSSIVIVLLALAFINIANTSIGYSKTNAVNTINKNIIKNFLTDKSEENSHSYNEINLYKFPDDNYGWSMPYQSTYHEYYYKMHYKISDVKINWID